ncbi:MULTISPECIES: hypothetical protein [unclassified Methanoregula]|uniref:hypothetical protein n=1 Tax=unclassified Methanoregula TaxID=2649730 RepID=UPI0009CBB379|nr:MULTISPECIES: hypothetical protein [unclassified Methanoregula]OPX65320.1 MAG: hypothetical protein A4E33_00353 [Methanoregula sp. PtaB.Bin085]OPY32229.1 MAG: hypothetical protein A4E34_02603 [Methanoregula sp. PtaU1.Bin006]
MNNISVFLLTGVLCALLIASGCTGPAPASTATPAATTATTAVPVPSPETTVHSSPAPQTASWAGTWNTTWLETDNSTTIARVSLFQTGTDVTGNYTFTYPGEGTYTGHLNATASGNTLAGTYSESDDDTGFMIFELSGDTTSFTGRWVHAENRSMLADSTLWWNGTRV